MWRTKCQWIIQRNRPLDESVLRIAVEELIARHEALRAELRDPFHIFLETQRALTVFEIIRQYGDRLLGFSMSGFTGLKYVGRLLERIGCLGLSHSWPRVRVNAKHSGSAGSLPLVVFERVATADEARR